MAETLKPCWCNSRITTSSPSLTTQTSPEPSGVRWPPVGCWPAIAVFREVPSHPQRIEVTDFQPPDARRGEQAEQRLVGRCPRRRSEPGGRGQKSGDLLGGVDVGL